MKLILILILSFNFSCVLAFNTSLTQKDYLVLERKSRSMINSSIDSSMFYANLIGQSDNVLHQAFSSGLKSYLYQIKGNSQKSDELYDESFVLLERSRESNEKIRVKTLLLNYGGLINWRRGNFSESLKKYEEGRTLSDQINDQVQLIKFNNNISRLNGQVGNFKSAIQAARNSEIITNKIQETYTKEGYQEAKSSVYFNLGYFYECYGKKINNDDFVDSAIYYYNRSINFSELLVGTKLSAQVNTANLYLYKEKRKQAEKMYFNAFKIAKENDYVDKQVNVAFNLGYLYYEDKKYSEALSSFQTVDSLHRVYKDYGIGEVEVVLSNFYKADIYEMNGDTEKAEFFAKKFSREYEKMIHNHEQEVLEMNFLMEKTDFKKEVQIIKNRIQARKMKFYAFTIGIILVLVALAFFLRKTVKDKRRANAKVEKLILEFKEQKKGSNVKKKLKSQSLTIKDEKEKEILKKLEKMVEKEYYRSSDFNLQSLAKKIKTNTTYLSHVVNNHFGKSFSEYSNELKVNFVIEQLMTNKTYRKYSTQAMAESVGFKNATSFTKSFKKRTGVTPVQFLNNTAKQQSDLG